MKDIGGVIEETAMRFLRWMLVSTALVLILGDNTSVAQNEHRPFPETADGIHVFNDQIDVHHLTDAQVAFAATHYTGTQKLTRSSTDRLRAYNPNFIVLHYRLGLGIGYQTAGDDCKPAGEYLEIIHGDEWVQEWPGDDVMQEKWLYHYDGQRVYWCAWGWYLADTDHAGWRDWWLGEIRQQLVANANDGLFADSVTVPNFLGADDWMPALPAYDEVFEAGWTRRIEDWMIWLNTAFGDDFALIVNAGQLVTTRETTDYSLADGVMVEGFAGWDEHDRFETGDWTLQINRILALVNQDRTVILQSYVFEPAERLWQIANYLLVKGNHTYINLEMTQDIEWFPEYDLPVGRALTPPPDDIEQLRTASGLYARTYDNALVLVNPDPFGAAQTVTLDTPMHLVTGSVGGGDVPDDADITGWRVETVEVNHITVQPGQAAILLHTPPAIAQLIPETTIQPIGNPAQPDNIAAFHRSGQTFITWPEIAGDPTQTYHIYRHAAPLPADTIAQMQPIAEVPQGSGIFWTERARALEPPYEDAGYVSLHNYVIDDLGPQLPDGTGLFVWTTHEDGTFYYTVAAGDGTLIDTTGPINEQIAAPAPVLVWESANGLSRVYTQFMDYATYNPTFDAPRPGNGWMNLPDWEELERTKHQQYAYNYWVGLPSPGLCGGAVPAQMPLLLHIEGWGSRYTVPADALYFCAVHLWADDPNQSWYYGFSATHDYHADSPIITGPIVNYTEERLIRAVREVLRDPLYTNLIDVQRIYSYGHSMGATGALMLAERYPHIFAAIYANQPMLNFGAAALWVPELESKWGAQILNLPIENRGTDAAHLTTYNGTGVWDWQNLAEQLSTRRGDDMAFIAISHGVQDTVIDWQSVVQPAYEHFYTGNRGFIGEIQNQDHTWVGFLYHPNWTFDMFNMRRDESFPALSLASGSLSTPPPSVGAFNMTLEWSAWGNDFAGPIVDTPNEWIVVVRSMEGDQTVDVTPRRLQQFVVQLGQTYTWQNTQWPDGTLLQEGVITPDADGLLVLPDVIVTDSGNQIVITRQ